MKNIKFYIILVITISSALVFQGCGSRLSDTLSLTKAKMENQLATKAELLMDNMIEVYNTVQDLSFESEFDGAVAGILASSVESYEPSQLVNDSIRAKMTLLQLYKQAVHEYALLADEGFTGQQAALAKCGQSIIDAYKKIDDSTSIKLAFKINPIIQSSRYDQNLLMIRLMESLEEVWGKDVVAWNSLLNMSFLDYQVALSLIPDESFSEENLVKYVNQPFSGKHNLVEVYKINLIKERRNMLNDLVQKQDKVTSSLQYLKQALTEFEKSNCDKTVVMNYLNRIEMFLATTETKSNE